MFESFAALFPAEWRGTITLLAAPLRWIPEWQAMVLRSAWLSYSPAATVTAAVVLLLPVLLLIVGMWCTMLSLYTLPFRSARAQFIPTLMLTWWDALHAVWLFWVGMFRFVGVALGWLVTLRTITHCSHRIAGFLPARTESQFCTSRFQTTQKSKASANCHTRIRPSMQSSTSGKSITNPFAL
jgi:hypothetical protein